MYVEMGIKVGEDGSVCVVVNAAGEAFLSFEDTRLDTTYMGETCPAADMALRLRALADAVQQAATLTAAVDL